MIFLVVPSEPEESEVESGPEVFDFCNRSVLEAEVDSDEVLEGEDSGI